MSERIKNELSLEAGRNALGSLKDVVSEKDWQLVFTVVAQAVKHAIEMYQVRLEWAKERGIVVRN